MDIFLNFRIIKWNISTGSTDSGDRTDPVREINSTRTARIDPRTEFQAPADAVTIQIDAGSLTVCPLTKGVSASRMEFLAAARMSAG